MTDPVDLLSFHRLEAEQEGRIGQAGFRLHRAYDAEGRAEAIARVGARIRAVLTTGSLGLGAAQMAGMPALEIAVALGAGFEGIDLDAARARGIAVANSPGANADSVADHAMGLLLAIVRGLPAADRAVREGRWTTHRSFPREVAGGRLGLVGLGHIGRGVAARGGGFGMSVGYHARREVAESGFAYFGDVGALAEWADFLVVAAPGGPETHHMIDAAVLGALGKEGYLVNVGRGSIVDSEALAEALRTETIAGAALDVIEGEPAVPPALAGLPNIVFSPHIGGRSPRAAARMLERVIETLSAHFEGRPVPNPVPGAG